VNDELYQDVLGQIADGVSFVTLDGRITYWNSGAEHITGHSAHEVLGHSCSEGILSQVDDAGRQLCMNGCPLAAVMKDGHPRQAHVYLHHKDGQRVPVTVRSQALRDPQGAIVGAVEVFSTLVANPYAGQRRVRRDGSLDPTTGLATRSFGELHLQTLMRAVAQRATTLGMLYIDVDHFKDVNDKFGHKTGDDVLRMVGQSLANGLRHGDIPIRWGGDKFLALLVGTDRAGLHVVAERVRMLLENSWIQRGEVQARVTASVGATMAIPTETSDDLVDRADMFMYASKRDGRNRVTTDTGALKSEADRPIQGTAIHCDHGASDTRQLHRVPS
jgi:diguanylate cyclase (GGDEF)-like protein/PAS domain S-box-containing protein